MSKMVRRNASDKLKLIKMVHGNPILWDSRLPNFKGAEEEKSFAWTLIGNEFGVPGRRVARAFKSLRESYRRELALVKTMGEGFQPKWSLFQAMDFLRDVIRERKNNTVNGETSLGFNKSAISNNNNTTNNSSMSKNMSSTARDDYSFFVKSEIDLDATDNRISSTLNGNYDDMDDITSEDSNQVPRNHHHHRQQHHNMGSGNEVEELEAIDADFPYPLIIDNNSPQPNMKRRRRNSSSDDEGGAVQNIQPTVREVLNSKFCGFITAKLNSMEDSEADNLMNRILMLLVASQTVVPESK